MIDDPNPWARVKYTIKNIGPTPARIKYVEADCYQRTNIAYVPGPTGGIAGVVATGTGLPQLKIARPVDNSPPYEQIIPAGLSWEKTEEHKFAASHDLNAVLNVPYVSLTIHGIIVYFDIFKDQHFTRFCWRYKGPGLVGPQEAVTDPWKDQWAIPPEYNDSD